MNSFSTPPGELIKRNDFVTIGGVPFVRSAAHVFRRKQTLDEQDAVLKALQRIKLEAVVRPASDAGDVLTIQEVRFGRAVVRYSQHQNDFCVLCFEVLTTFPKQKGLKVLRTFQVRIRDGTCGPVRSRFERRRRRYLLNGLLTVLSRMSIHTLYLKGQSKCLEPSNSSYTRSTTLPSGRSMLVYWPTKPSTTKAWCAAYRPMTLVRSPVTEEVQAIPGLNPARSVGLPSTVGVSATTLALLKVLAAGALPQRPIGSDAGARLTRMATQPGRSKIAYEPSSPMATEPVCHAVPTDTMRVK